MIISWALIAVLNAQALPPTVEFIDSRDDNKIIHVFVTHDNKTCHVKINKAELKDYDKVIVKVMEKCGL